MNYSQKLFLLLFLTSCAVTQGLANLKIVCSAALLENQFEMRKKEYIACFETLKSYGYEDLYIIDAIKKHGPTFLDSYSSHVFYSKMNNTKLQNKGVNEAKTLLEGLKYFSFDPNEMILKLTGRYQLLSNSFIQIVENNADADAIIKLDQLGQVYTFCFAMKYKYLIDFFEQLDYATMENHMINIEQRMAEYIKKIITKHKAKVLIVDKLDIAANIFGTGSPTLVYR